MSKFFKPMVLDGTGAYRSLQTGEYLNPNSFPPEFIKDQGKKPLDFPEGGCRALGRSFVMPYSHWDCDTVFDQYEIVRHNNFYWVSTKPKNKSQPGLQGADYMGGFTHMGAIIKAIADM